MMTVMRTFTGRLVAGLTIMALAVGAAPSLAPPMPAAPIAAPTPAAGAGPTLPALPKGAAALSKADLDAWLDGYMPYALKAGDIAGAEVFVVKDGQILTQRGFGLADVEKRRPVDPATTLFRLGSVSKLFTWTAVMQQVQAGKLDLDRDVNAYLDFKIPARAGKPVTLRHLMTHTAGFAEVMKYLIAYDPKALARLDVVLKRIVPGRIYAEGSMPAYSNYGASLAGYIVERVSGEPFDAYVERHIFAPIGMTHSSFRQPLPEPLRPFLSQGYLRASEGPKSFELIPLAPAGSLTASGPDMARFMIAFLQGGGPLLAPATVRQMLAPANRPIPDLPAMALGFYHEDRNGQTIVGHGGDTEQFHSDLHLYLDQGVGLYVSFNSAGKEGAAHVAREALFTHFTDRYFPAPDANVVPPTLATARDHGAAMSGHYVSSRASGFTFARLITLLGQTSVALNEDGTISVSDLTDAAGVPKRWHEVAPWQWREVGGADRLHAVVEDGRVRMFSVAAFAPIFEFLPAPAGLDAGWITPLALAALLVLLCAAFAWPIVALVRRAYARPPLRTGRALLIHRALGATAWAGLAILIGWVMIIQALTADLTLLDGRLDLWMRVLQLLSLLFIAGALLALWQAWERLRAFRGAKLMAIWAGLFALSALFLAWLIVDLGLLTLSLDY